MKFTPAKKIKYEIRVNGEVKASADANTKEEVFDWILGTANAGEHVELVCLGRMFHTVERLVIKNNKVLK